MDLLSNEPAEGDSSVVASKVIPLSTLRTGQRAIVVQVQGDRQRRRRYLEMGFVRGEMILVKRVAPLGDPIEYVIKGTHLSLRRSDAAEILIRPFRP